jgi:hypothetical protein
MSSQPDLAHLTVEQFSERFKAEMIPLGAKFSYFCIALPMSEEDTREYLTEPLAAIPPAILNLLPSVAICLVPYLERTNGKAGDYLVTLERPPENREAVYATVNGADGATLLFGIQDREVAEYHYYFYRALAEVVAPRVPPEVEVKYFGQLREELGARVHGEVDEASWRLKQALARRQTNVRKESKGFREYAVQSFIDTLTLYMHGLCCDIDIDTGPRQLPSRYLRKRLELLRSLFPPPEGYALFPDEARS